MNLNNLPNDNHDRMINLKGRRDMILELFEHFTEHHIALSSDIGGGMQNELDEVNDLLSILGIN